MIFLDAACICHRVRFDFNEHGFIPEPRAVETGHKTSDCDSDSSISKSLTPS
jgi:hypothetical protein